MRVDVWRGENLQEHGCLRDDLGMAIGGAHSPEGIQDLQRIAHRYNNFPRALEALKRATEALANMTRGGVFEKECANNDVCDELDAVIAELKKVK